MSGNWCLRCNKLIKRDYYYCPACIAQIALDNKEWDRIFEEEKRRGR